MYTGIERTKITSFGFISFLDFILSNVHLNCLLASWLNELNFCLCDVQRSPHQHNLHFAIAFCGQHLYI